ncbi:MAG TPA: metal-dependent hydrolase [Vicinamibacterales bacterium]|nr:metal-dependent hydrolase [Vicinamibacterales bacterium]
MPTPVGHALGALILTAPIRARYRLLGAGAAVGAVAFGVAPDLDLLIGRHSAETHSIGAAALTGALAWLFLRSRGRPRAGPLAAVLALAVLSHAMLDWLGTDTSTPIGIMALWPFGTSYYESDVHVFMAVSRRYWLDEFWSYNLRVLARELLLLGVPALAIEWLLRRRKVR